MASRFKIQHACAILDGTSDLVSTDADGDWFALDLPFETYDDVALEWLCDNTPRASDMFFFEIGFRELTQRAARLLINVRLSPDITGCRHYCFFNRLHTVF